MGWELRRSWSWRHQVHNEKFVDMEHNEKFVHLGIPISFVGHQTILCQADYLSGLKSSEGRPAL